MGQPISDTIRQKMSADPRVGQVTAEHVILRTGEVLDPSEFIVEGSTARFILKLTECGCLFRRHQVGRHAVVQGKVLRYGDGRERLDYLLPAVCPRGRWTLEETLPGPVIIKRSY